MARRLGLIGALASAWLAVAAPGAQADGAMVYRGRELFREGPGERGYCEAGGSGSRSECDRVLAKVLSGYSYGRGHVTLGLSVDPDTGRARGAARVRASVVSAALPGGDVELGALEALGTRQDARLRAALVDGEGLFFCRDQQTGEVALPIAGMLTRACATDAVLALDAGFFALQWELPAQRWVAEWARLGPSFELLGNGLGYAHTLRSVMLGVPFDVRSVHERGRPPGAETSLGAGLRISTLYRTPHWEARLEGRHRTALAGGRGPGREHALEGELRLLRNFFASDAVVLQAGLALHATWSARDREPPSLFAGVHLGWSHEAPDI